MKKRGQITIFIIISLIILISVSLFLYYNALTIQEPEIVPPQFDPVRDYVQSCLYLTGKEAVELLGQQSGYIDIPQEWLLNQDSYIAIDNLGLINVPYWYYKGESRIPSVNSMQQQISDFIESNLKSCLMDFEVFENTFSITEKRDIKLTTTIDQDDVRIEANYLLRVKSKADAEATYLSDFTAILDVKLMKAYELAVNIMKKENEQLLLENVTMDLVAMHPDMPLSGMTFHCGQERWYIEDIKEELSSMLRYQLSRVRIKNTDYIDFAASEEEYEYFRQFTPEKVFAGSMPDRTAPEDAYDYFHYYWDVESPKTDLRATMQYEPDWGMEITARPSYGGVLKSSVGTGAQKYLRFMCVNFYHFTYDITYPVITIVGENSAFNNDGFIFRYAFPVLVKKNEGNRVNFGQDVYDVPLEYINYCGDLSGPSYNIRVRGTDEGGYTNMDLNEVNLSYDCYKYRCHLGTTKPEAGSYKLVAMLPSFCAHGYLVAEKPGYLETRQQVLNEQNIVIDMKKLNRFKFSILMHDYQSLPPAHIEPNAVELAQDMEVLVNIQHSTIPGFNQYLTYPFDEDTEENMRTIELLDENAVYFVDIMLTNEKFGLLGGYRANWTVSSSEMVGADHIIFHTINYLPVPYRIDDQYKLAVFLDENKEYKTGLKPVFGTG